MRKSLTSAIQSKTIVKFLSIIILLGLTILSFGSGAAQAVQVQQTDTLVQSAFAISRTPTPTPSASSSDELAPEPNGALNPQIVGGTEVNPPGLYPWQVALVSSTSTNFRDPGNGLFCGGSIIADYWVMTAAHCVVNRQISSFDVVAGTHNLRYPEIGYQRIDVSNVIMHSDYDPNTKVNDIALLKLATPVTLGAAQGLTVGVISLAGSSTGIMTGTMAVATGWGSLTNTKQTPDWPNALQMLELPINGGDDASLLIGNDQQYPCFGDSGGPLAIRDNQTWKLVGIASHGAGDDSRCVPPVSYVRVSRYIDWIMSRIDVGTIGGLVKNISGQPVNGAIVKFMSNGVVRTIITDNGGIYTFVNVPAGAAKITAIGNGFSGSINVNVVANQSQNASDILLSTCASFGCLMPGVPNASFITDITLPDGIVISPGQSLVKTWRLRNTGTTAWGPGYNLKFKRGDQMGAPNEVSVPTTGPNGIADISVNMTAPTTPGTYKGYWQLWSPTLNGVFGPEIWIQIQVPDNSQPPQTGDVILTCSNCPGVVTPGQQFRPIIQAKIVNGALLQSRGDMLRHTSEPYYTDFPHIGVVGNHYAGETYNFQFYADHPIVTPTAEGTYESKWRIWRDGNWAGDEFVIRFIVRNGGGTVPNVPTLSSPADGWTDFSGCPTPPQLSVQSQGAGIQFNFQVDPSAPQDSGWIDGLSWTPSSLGQTEHIWRVKARDAGTGLESDWSSQRRFTCSSTNYSIPYMLFSPASPTSVDRVKIWTCADVPSEVGRGIEVYANTATDGSNSGEWQRVWPILNGDCTADWQNHPEWWPEEDLRFLSNGTHLIQARAWAGPRDNPIKSMVRESLYTLDDRRPAQVRQISPESQQWFNSRTITFRWEPEEVSRSEQFILQVSTDSNPSVSPIVNQTSVGSAREFTYTFNQDYPVLYWGIKACKTAGTPCSDLGSVQFGIDRTPAASFVNILPITIYDTVQTVTWQCADNANGSGCQRYDVQVRDGPFGEWQDWRTAVTEISGLFRGLPGHQYCFRSRALDKAGNLETWPATANGDTCATIDLDNQPQTWWNANYSFKRKLTVLNWDGHTLNSGFPVHAHFDGTTTPTAAEIYNGSQAVIKGDDVRVIYQDTTEVSRFIQAFTSSAIDICFDLQADVGPNPDSSADYQLYYGNPAASSPPADPGNVFMPPKDSGVVASWYLSEWGGNTAADNSGNGHTATRVNGGQWVTTVHGPAIDLVKDSKQYLIVNDPASLNLSNFTFEAWFWRDHSDVGALISKWRDDETDSSYLFGIQQRKIMLRLRSTSGQYFEVPENEQGSFNFEDNQGYHVAATYDGSKVRFYVNGELKYTKDWTGGVMSSSKNVLLGVQQSQTGDPPYSLNGYFDGLVSGIRISNYARTSFPYASFALVTNAPEVSAGAEATYESPTIQPDLAVLGLTTYPASVNQGGGLIAQAIVKNQGTRATRNGAWTLMYADHQPTVGDLNGISFWLGTPIQAGAIATLTAYITSTSTLGMMSASANQPLAESNHTVYVQADATGVTKDSNRANNISSGTTACLANPDAYEPNDTPSAAPLIAIGSTVRMNFHGTEDQDWVRFTAQGGVTYTIKTFDLDMAADTYLYLYSTDGTTLLASNDDYAGSLASYLEWTAPVTGTYYAMVRDWNPNVGGCGTAYSLSVAPSVHISHVYLPMVLRGFNFQ